MLKEKVRIKKTVTLNSFQGLIRRYRIKCGMTVEAYFLSRSSITLQRQ